MTNDQIAKINAALRMTEEESEKLKIRFLLTEYKIDTAAKIILADTPRPIEQRVTVPKHYGANAPQQKVRTVNPNLKPQLTRRG